MATRKEKSKRKKHYSSEFKLNAIKLTIKPDRTIQAVTAELGIPELTLSKWRHDFKQKEDLKKAQESELAIKENDKLQDEIKRLKMENEILKQAAIYFAGQK